MDRILLVVAGIAALAGVLLLAPLSPTATDAIAQEADAYLTKLMELQQFNGAVLIARGDQLLLKKGYGFANYEWGIKNTPQTKFRIGSLTKQFTAAAILQLQEQGLLSVDDALSEYIPDYPEGDRITLHHLLTHTSGIFDITSIPGFLESTVNPSPVEETIEWFKHKPMDFEPGSDYKYSNSGYVLLGHIIEKVSGQRFGDYLKTHIFEPLNMHNSGQDLHQTLLEDRASGYSMDEDNRLMNARYIDMSVPIGGGSLYSTVEDLYLWDRALYEGPILNQNSLEAMFTPYLANYAYGWGVVELFGRKRISHTGGINGFASNIARYVEDDLVIIVLSNFEFAPMVQISRDLAAIAFSEPFDLPS